MIGSALASTYAEQRPYTTCQGEKGALTATPRNSLLMGAIRVAGHFYVIDAITEPHR